MDSPDGADLLARLEAAEARLDALERTSTSTPSGAASPTPVGTPAAGNELWALEELTRQSPAPGAVMLVGAVVTPEGLHAHWQEGRTAADLLADDWTARAASLTALAHPVRLQILRLALDGPVTARELGEQDDLGTSGQVYHHLRQLTATGWWRSRSGRHSVPVERVVPLLAVVAGVDR